MTQDEIMFMAMKSGCPQENALANMDILQDFAKLVAAEAFQAGYEKGVAGFTQAVKLEREACAKLCETLVMGKHSAAAIRARGETTLRGEA
jgi:hypothetical protein